MCDDPAMIEYRGETYYDIGWVLLFCGHAALIGAAAVLLVVAIRRRPFEIRCHGVRMGSGDVTSLPGHPVPLVHGPPARSARLRGDNDAIGCEH